MLMKRLSFFLLPLLVLLTACRDDSPNANPVPDVPVYTTITLNTPQYQSLNMLGGYAYVDAGYRGIVVVRDLTDRFWAFDRACTYHPEADCAKVSVDSSGLFLRCGHYTDMGFEECCSSRYYSDGSVAEGPARFPLKPYMVSRVGAAITIRSY